MNRFRSIAIRLLCLLTLLSLLSVQGVATARTPAQAERPERPFQPRPIPAELQALIDRGLSIEEFLAMNGGRVPYALQNLQGVEVTVVIQLQDEPLAALYARQTQAGAQLSAADQQAYVANLTNAQAPVRASVEALGGRVISQYTKAYNGIMARVPISQIENIRSLPGVRDVRRAPKHYPALAESVPHIRADAAAAVPGVNGGDGVTIAIIDTGVDYNHAALGGSGDPNDYENNDPDDPSDGDFPNLKVIGGYDFAGTNYDADSDIPANTIPVPDGDPLDENGHGTHVASTAAGEGSSDIGEGVAPNADIYALKVFGVSGSTNLVVDAIEWALDPNGDGDLEDRVDVINMSLGSAFGFTDLLDPEFFAVEYATDVGVVVVAASGNAGDVHYITDAPAAADSAISVAASTTAVWSGPTVTINDAPVTYTRTEIIYAVANFDAGGSFDVPVTAPLYHVSDLPGATDDLLCDIPPGATNELTGQIALIQRGACDFFLKVNNAADLGAVAAIIYNHEDGGNLLITMGGDPVDIPAGFVPHDDGLILVDAAADGLEVTVSAGDDISTQTNPFTPADTIADFSSRGPRSLDAYSKPDVTAPGVSIVAAAMGSGAGGVAFNGTSMATPHVAGVAALVRALHPEWSPEQIKAAIMNTAVDLAEGSQAVPLQGAGRVDALNAVSSDAFAIGDEDQISLSWGVIEIDQDTYQDAKNITLHDLSNTNRTYTVTVEMGEGSLTDGATVSVITDTIAFEADGTSFASLLVDLSIDPTVIQDNFFELEEYYGYVVFTPDDMGNRLRVPFYFVPDPQSDVLVTDISGRPGGADIQIAHTGPISASLWAYPLYDQDPNEPTQHDSADLRMIGIDTFSDPSFGDFVAVAINTYDGWLTPQPYFSEFDWYVDVDEDDIPDYVFFNWNFGAASGSDDDDDWVVVRVNLAAGIIDSAFSLATDFNSGLMEYFIPQNALGLPAGDTSFNWQMIAFDAGGDVDESAMHSFDVTWAPFTFGVSNDPGPGNSTATLSVSGNLGHIQASETQGVMLLDYNGEPGTGQAIALTEDVFANLAQLFNTGVVYLPLTFTEPDDSEPSPTPTVQPTPTVEE